MTARPLPGLQPPRPIPLKDRSSILFIERAQIDVIDGAFVAIDVNGSARTYLSAASLALCWSRARV